MTNEDLRTEVERLLTDRGMTIVNGHRGPKSQTDQRYRELIVYEEEDQPLAETIVDAMLGSRQKGKTIYWRIRPEFDEMESDRAYVRFLISDKPVIYQTEKESRQAAGLGPRDD